MFWKFSHSLCSGNEGIVFGNILCMYGLVGYGLFYFLQWIW